MFTYMLRAGGISILKKIAVVFMGVYILGLGVAIEIKANLGVNALTLFSQGVGNQINMSIGSASILFLTAITVITFFIDKKRIGLGTLINGVFSGAFIDLNINMFSFFTVDNIIVRISLMLLGIIITGIGIGIYASAGIGESGIDAVMIMAAEKLGISVKYVRMAIDFILIVCGVAMGGSIGISTVAALLLYGIVFEKTIMLINRFKTKGIQ